MKSEQRQENGLNLILMGPPGSGKGTQAQLLSADFGIPHISTGDIFRDHIKNKTPLGLKVQEIINAGKFPADSLVVELVQERLGREDCINGYVLDGFPRTLFQAEEYLAFCQNKGLLLVIVLDVADDVIVHRAAERVVCAQCGKVFNREVNPPQIDGVCDHCNGQLLRRPDDAAEVVLERLKIYREKTEPLIEFFDEKGVLTTFEGDQPLESLHEELHAFIEEMMN